MTKEISFGTKKALMNKKPTWARVAYRVSFALTKGFVAYLAVSQIFPEKVVYEITMFVSLVAEPVFLLVSNMFGVKEDR